MKPEYSVIDFPVAHPKGSCRVCGCTEEKPCKGGCHWWAGGHVCSRCVERAEALLTPPKRSLADFQRVLEAETNPNVLALALRNATGDWRRVALHKRMQEVPR